MTDVVPSGSILLYFHAQDDTSASVTIAKRASNRLWRAFVSLISTVPIVNGVSAAADRADWLSAACLINYGDELRVIHYGEIDNKPQICMTPLNEYVKDQHITRYAIRKLYASQTDAKISERLVAAMCALENGGAQSDVWRSDPLVLLSELYFRVMGIGIDACTLVLTAAESFGTGGAIDEALYRSANRTYLLGPEHQS